MANLGKALGVTLLLAWFFYRSFWALIPMLLPGALYYRKCVKEKIARDREVLEAQFCECIESVGTSVRSGASVETAFLAAYPTMETLFGKNSMICEELRGIRRGLSRNIPLEKLLRNLADRAGIDAISRFAEVFAIVKRSGGRMEDIIRSSAELIRIRQNNRREIRAILGARRAEMKIMRIMPFLIVIYVSMGQPAYFDPLYGNQRGALIMSGMLVVYLAAYLLGEGVLGKLEGDV